MGPEQKGTSAYLEALDRFDFSTKSAKTAFKDSMLLNALIVALLKDSLHEQ
jgi:hypothetical protein